jgi:hypothetical protein
MDYRDFHVTVICLAEDQQHLQHLVEIAYRQVGQTLLKCWYGKRAGTGTPG